MQASLLAMEGLDPISLGGGVVQSDLIGVDERGALTPSRALLKFIRQKSRELSMSNRFPKRNLTHIVEERSNMENYASQ